MLCLSFKFCWGKSSPGLCLDLPYNIRRLQIILFSWERYLSSTTWLFLLCVLPPQNMQIVLVTNLPTVDWIWKGYRFRSWSVSSLSRPTPLSLYVSINLSLLFPPMPLCSKQFDIVWLNTRLWSPWLDFVLILFSNSFLCSHWSTWKNSPPLFSFPLFFFLSLAPKVYSFYLFFSHVRYMIA